MSEERISLEECPLKEPQRQKYHYHSYYQCQKRPTSLKGPLRVVRLCVLGIVLPTTLISLPLYLRYHVYVNQLYPFAVSDMRLLDGKMSTVWCQKQLVKVNATFNAFLMSQPPNVAPNQKSVSMVRDLLLEDDMKEYWGFYLLKGSTVTVSTCVRWPGASLIVIRGHKHLHECAYIGDDSSEELEELMDTSASESDSSGISNRPYFMKRHHPDVRFHHPLHHNSSSNYSIYDKDDEETDTPEISDPKAMKNLLDSLAKKTAKNEKKGDELLQKFEEENSRKPKENLTSSEELFRELSKKLDGLGGNRQHKVLRMLNERTRKSFPRDADGDTKGYPDDNPREKVKRRKRNLVIATAMADSLNADEEDQNVAIEEGFVPDGIADHRGFFNETTMNDRSNSEFWSSFSSSEEALLNCAGLILNLPLTPHHHCTMNQPETQLDNAALTNTITYLVPSNGYYFFVFNSENEVQVNYIRVRFHLNKTMYDVSHPVSSCSNTSDTCSLDLKFFSNEKMVMELPETSNESRWNEEFIVESECEPRTLLYVICVVSVPVLIVLFAFQ